MHTYTYSLVRPYNPQPQRHIFTVRSNKMMKYKCYSICYHGYLLQTLFVQVMMEDNSMTSSTFDC